MSSEVPALLSSLIQFCSNNASSGDGNGDDDDHRYKATLAACSCLSNLCTQNARLNEAETLSTPTYLTPLLIALSNNDSGFTEKQVSQGPTTCLRREDRSRTAHPHLLQSHSFYP